MILCISTMAAAGMGNMVSDLAGIDCGNENGGIAVWNLSNPLLLGWKKVS